MRKEKEIHYKLKLYKDRLLNKNYKRDDEGR